MKAIYLTQYGDSNRVFQIKDTPIPTVGKGQVVIKVACFGLNFADVIARRGMYPDAPKNPAVLGYDVAGTVYAIGEGVEGLAVGQRVAALTRFGGYAEYALTAEAGVVRIPDSMDYPTAVALATQGATAYYCAEEAVKLHAGDRVLIQAAAGGVGSILVQMAKHKGCFIFGTASTKKIEFLKQLGVDVPIDYTATDFFTFIKNYDDSSTPSVASGVDVVFDSLGGSVFKKSIKLLNAGGRMVSFGAAEQIKGRKTGLLRSLPVLLGFGLYSPIQLLMASKSIIGVNMLTIADKKPQIVNRCIKGIMDLAAQGIVRPHIDKVFAPEAIAEAHDYLESRRSMGKIVIEW